jgi:AcrR family transcriptional regulator
MAKESRAAGRPRTFDERDVIDQAVTTFWKYGGTNTTMRVLERELGLMPASIYNAFGSKQQLLERALDSYLAQVADQLLSPLEMPEAESADLIRFVDELVAWVTNTDHPGCLMLNLLAEQPSGGESLPGFGQLHRERMRTAFHPALARIDASRAEARANLLVASVTGISLAARGGASQREIADLAVAVQDQIGQWSGS